MTPKAFRRKHDISQAELARRADLSQSQVAEAEKGIASLYVALRLSLASEGAIKPWEVRGVAKRHKRAIREYAESVGGGGTSG